MLEIKSKDNKTFEEIKRIDDNGSEFWFARELYPVLEYSQWRRFEEVIKKAMVACDISQNDVADHFANAGKTVEMPSSAKPKIIKDYKLTRYACYLIVMNGDPRKEVIALAQTYFAVKTRQQEFAELFGELDEDSQRLFLRSDIKQKNQLLAEVAKKAGIETSFEYAEFQDSGYMGLYGGLTAKDIASKKQLKKGQEILDYMGSEELGANLFRITQTQGVMKRNKTATPKEACETHYRIGKGVRKTIEEFGNTMPEDLPMPKKSIKQVESEKYKRLKGGKK